MSLYIDFTNEHHTVHLDQRLTEGVELVMIVMMDNRLFAMSHGLIPCAQAIN